MVIGTESDMRSKSKKATKFKKGCTAARMSMVGYGVWWVQDVK